MDRAAIVKCWSSQWAPRTPSELSAFSESSEVEALIRFPDQAVEKGIRLYMEPADILRHVESVAWWYRGEQCEADGREWCGRCKPHGFPETVHMSSGWRAETFHKSSGCDYLAAGQAKVSANGGDPAPIVKVNIQVALGKGKLLCMLCFPGERRR